MALPIITLDPSNVSALPDEPNDTGTDPLTPTELKAVFDKFGVDYKAWFNNTFIPALIASNVPFTPTSAVNEATVQAAIVNVQNQLATAILGSIPDNSIATAKYADDSVTEAKMANHIVNAIQNSILNTLAIKLQLALSHSDFDAWSDLLADSSRLALASCADIMVDSGSLKTNPTITLQSTSGQSAQFGVTTQAKIGQAFTPLTAITLNAVKLKLYRAGSATGTISLKLYSTSSGLPNTLLATSSTTYDGAALPTTATEKTFAFAGVALSPNVKYAVVLESSNNANNPFDGNALVAVQYVQSAAGAAFLSSANGSSWEQSASNYLDFIATGASSGVAIWTAVTPTEALTYAAIVANQTVGSGSITWYLSDDGTNWTQITALDTIQTVGFDAAHIYLKCALTGNATVESVAYGGY